MLYKRYIYTKFNAKTERHKINYFSINVKHESETGKLSSLISIELVDSCKGETNFIINIVSTTITNIKIIGIVRNVMKHYEKILFC